MHENFLLGFKSPGLNLPNWFFVLTTSLLSFWLSATQKQGCGAGTGNGRNRIHLGTPAPEPEPYSEYGYKKIKQKTQKKLLKV
jgi:hypothetical protein